MTRFKIDVPSWFKPGDAVVQATPFIKGRVGSVEGKRIQMWVKIIDDSESPTDALVTPMAQSSKAAFTSLNPVYSQYQPYFPQYQSMEGQSAMAPSALTQSPAIMQPHAMYLPQPPMYGQQPPLQFVQLHSVQEHDRDSDDDSDAGPSKAAALAALGLPRNVFGWF